MTKAARAIIENVKKMNGLCHAGTISAATGYKIETVKRHLAKMESDGLVINNPVGGVSSWSLA